MPYRYGKTIVYKYGERGSGLPPRGSVQDFYKLRDNCLDNGTLFEDRNFVADSSSIYYSKTPDRPLKWRRPHEIVDDPLLFVDGPSRFDIMQGELGNCWLLAAMANLTLHKHLFYQVVPDDQGYKYKYAGIFHFRFWQYGRWVDVVIDDKLPTVYGKLLFLHSSQNNEFWSALLEKAYAKIHGSYEALKEGTTGEAMEDFTGGITEMFDLTHILPNLYQIMLKAYQRTSLMACAIEADPHIVEAMTPEGLVKGHAYSITMVKSFNDTNGSTGKVHLIRLRNPWGNKVEWNGPWSDTSREWRLIPEHIKEEIGLIFDTDGEFWMSFEDFKRHFSVLEICSLNPDCLQDVTLACDKKQWEMSMYEGEWVRGVTAGGCRNFLETFSHNPQYQITLEEIDEDDDENKCTVVIALMQKNRRSQKMMGVEVLSIGFVCYHLEDPDKLPKPLGKQFFKYNKTAGRSPSFVNLREVNSRFKFPPGVYCIVPSTFEPDEEGEFILRVFSENKHNLKENDEELGMERMDAWLTNAVPQREEMEGESQAKQSFFAIAGENKEVDWQGLKEILDYTLRSELKRNEFSKDICRSLVAMKDDDRSGKLRYEEFKCLWREIRDWKTVYKMFVKDGSGFISACDLRKALNSAGYRLNNRTLNILVHRYGTKNRTMSFDDFLMCTVKLKGMIDIFKESDPDGTNSATFTMDEWIINTIYS